MGVTLLVHALIVCYDFLGAGEGDEFEDVGDCVGFGERGLSLIIGSLRNSIVGTGVIRMKADGPSIVVGAC